MTQEARKGERALYENLPEALGINLDFSMLDQEIKLAKVKETMSREGIEATIPDRAPFLTLDSAVVFENHEGKDCLLTTASINEADCEGHLPGQPMIPLIHLSKIMALSGRLLSAFETQGPQIVAEVVETGPVRSLLTLADLQYAKPPARILAFVEMTTQEKRSVTTNCQTWIVTGDRFIPAGRIDGLKYSIIPQRIFSKALRGKEETA